MKSAYALLLSLLALSLGTAPIHAQAALPFNGSTANINPTPGDCCECISFTIRNMRPGDQLYPNKNGTYTAYVSVYGQSYNPNCPDFGAVTAELFRNGIPIKKYVKKMEALDPQNDKKDPHRVLEFTLDASVAQKGDLWVFYAECAFDGKDDILKSIGVEN